MVTFTINIPQMLAYIPYMDPLGNGAMVLTSISLGCWDILRATMVVYCTDGLDGLRLNDIGFTTLAPPTIVEHDEYPVVH
jgi:hypothetical protein